MLSERQLQALLQLFDKRMQGVTDQYLKDMGAHLKNIGQLLPSDVNRLVEMKRIGVNVDRIKREIAKAAQLNIKDIETVFAAVAQIDYSFARKFYGEAKQIPIRQNKALLRILQAQARVTAQQMENLSRTTILTDSYRRAVDVAVQAAQSGVTDYNSAIRTALKQAAKNGLQVEFPQSGMRRRVESAVRQNVLDGIRQLNNDVLWQTGKEFGADGVEISAHALCAEDHLPYQGKQYSMREFETLQNTLDRPFGMWNCKHTRWPIIMGISEPAHDAAYLERLRRSSSMRIDIGGEVKTRYQWTQEQRRIETAIRVQNDVVTAAKAAGDDFSRLEAQRNIADLIARYDYVSEKAGLELRYDRTVGVTVPKSKKLIRTVKNYSQSMNVAVDRLPNRVQDAILSSGTKVGGGGVQFIGKIDRSIYSCVAEDISTDEVIITDKQIIHIFEGHGEEEHANVIQHLAAAVAEPDYILGDSDPRTAIVLKCITLAEEDERYRIILKLAADDPQHPKNSIITAFFISEKKWNKYIRNKDILYKRPEL